MKMIIVAASAAFVCVGAASASVPGKPVIEKNATESDVMVAGRKPSGRGGSAPSGPCSPFGCMTQSFGWG